MTDSQLPTLDSIPKMQLVGAPDHSLQKMISQMQTTGFHHWGFVIYRCSYTDDDLWERYMGRFKQEIRKYLEKQGELELLWQYLDITVIEDETLEAATKYTVRGRFRKWVNDHSAERDGSRVNLAMRLNVSRFSYCLFVDKKCLDTLTSEAAWVAGGRGFKVCANEGMSSYVVCALIDVQSSVKGQGAEGYPDIEGCTRQYTGWMYMSLDIIVEVYNFVSSDGLLAFGLDDYVRPPLVWPDTRPSSSIKA